MKTTATNNLATKIIISNPHSPKTTCQVLDKQVQEMRCFLIFRSIQMTFAKET